MKAINLRGITESLSESEMKNVVGGLDVPMVMTDDMTVGADGDSDCNQMKLGDRCVRGGHDGCCAAAPFAGYICKTPC